MKSSLFLIILFVIVFSGCQINKCNAQSILSDPHDLEWQSKLKALEVLQSKCNNCHRITNSNKVFATDNMDSFAQKIYEQVFVLQRMPKGKNKRKK